MRHYTALLLFICIVGIACNRAEQKNEKQATIASKNTEILYSFLKEQSGKRILFGQQDALAYGVGWEYEEGRADVKSLVNDLPAVIGWDLGNIGAKKNLDSVPFLFMRKKIIETFERGGISTLSWHTFHPVTRKSSWETDEKIVADLIPEGKHHAAYKRQLDSVADFLNNLVTSKGIKVPVVFRPFHELNGSWFWWGENNCSKHEYVQLFRFTIGYLKEKGVDNMLVAFSPDRQFNNEREYLDRYPGDDIVDVLGLDDYHDFKVENGDSLVAARLTIVAKIAAKKNKVAVFSETGFEGVPDSTWYSERLLKVLKTNEYTRQLAYVLVWRNANKKHHYVPYPGHKAANDFKKFYHDKIIAFQSEVEVPYFSKREVVKL